MTITLPIQSDLEVVYGASNIAQWADANNDRDPIARQARITWAVNNAYDYIAGRLSIRYVITDFVSLPRVVFDMIAKRAGIELCTSPRGLVDGDASAAQLNAMSLAAEAKLDQILAGQLHLLDTPSEPVNVPTIVNTPVRLNDCCNHNEQWTGEPCVGTYTRFYAG